MRRFVAISACVLVGAAPPANATDSGGLYRVFGVGGNSCGKYIDARRHDNDSHYLAWLGGYASAANHEIHGVKDILDGTDISGAMLWLENWCQSHPTEQFDDAVIALVRDRLPKTQ